MPKYVIEIGSNEPLEGVAEQVMLTASDLFHEAFPDQWREAMTALARAITKQVHEADEDHDWGPLSREAARAMLALIDEVRGWAVEAGLQPWVMQIDPNDEARMRAIAKGRPTHRMSLFQVHSKLEPALTRAHTILFHRGSPPEGAA